MQFKDIHNLYGLVSIVLILSPDNFPVFWGNYPKIVPDISLDFRMDHSLKSGKLNSLYRFLNIRYAWIAFRKCV